MTPTDETTLHPGKKAAWLLLPVLTSLLIAVAPVGATAIPLSAPAVRSPTWRMLCVDCPQAAPRVGERSLALDFAGRPHVVYGGENLHFAWRDGAVWHVEVVDAAPSILYRAQAAAALDLDGNDRPHIAYLNSNATALRYARKTADGWQLRTVASTTPDREMSYDVSLRVNRAGHPLISFYDATHGDLCVASQREGRWVVEAVDAVGDVGRYTALAFDASGHAHLSYYDATNGDLKYAVRRDGVWAVATVDAAGNVGLHTSLALDPAGRPYIAAVTAGNDALRYAWWTGEGWQVQTVRAGWQTVSFPTLVLEQGRPRIAFYDPAWRYLRLAWGEPFGLYLPLAERSQ